ncbi:MAG: tRNA lysidine(34) synthetase TilS [Oligoflexia bacterium]|nr:tRNA lysidine(34) synthetase TilS [Oligoflexia bacterium]
MRSYPKPGPVGGRLIREVIGLLRAEKMPLPLNAGVDSHILIALSGGADSLALALLLAKYGRRVVDRKKIRLLHVNHGWRGKESDADEAFVRDFAKRLKLRLDVVRLDPPSANGGESWEDLARQERKKIFATRAAKGGRLVLTAHQADDLAETVLWRLLTGASDTHGGGIAVRHGVELRPLLRVRKEALREFLLEEAQPWREDATNRDPRFQRARMRLELMPVLEALFPRSVEHLVALAFRAQQRDGAGTSETVPPGEWQETLGALFGSAGLKPRRAHWEWAAAASGLSASKRAELHLPQGWKLIREAQRNGARESWRLERDKPLECQRKS